MHSICLLPYCPLPINSGARAVFHKHLDLLNRMGTCRILSNRSRPVGFGWEQKHIQALCDKGFLVELNRSSLSLRPLQVYGILYALFYKSLRAEKAFGHSNPYHRYAFDKQWVLERSRDADICEIHYSYWARLPTACPKVVIVHDLWSDIMWEGGRRETEELGTADLVVTVSKTDRDRLKALGLPHVHWSPPIVERQDFDDADGVMIVGSDNRFNREGFRWLSTALNEHSRMSINLYGSLAGGAHENPAVVAYPLYEKATDPYKDNGIVLMTTAHGTGIQIKAIEALACGRAIIARQGAMRGLPDDDKGWLECNDPNEMLVLARNLRDDRERRIELMNKASRYYDEYLDGKSVSESLSERYRKLI